MVDNKIKRKYLESIAREPAGVLTDKYRPGMEDPNYNPNSGKIEVPVDQGPLEMPPLDLEGDLPVVQKPAPEVAQPASQEVAPEPAMRQPASKGTDMSGAYDALVGATPALLGFLSGNYNRTALGFDTGNAYLKNLHKEDLAASQNLDKTVVDGKPYFEEKRKLAGKEAWVAPSKLGTGVNGSGKTFQPQWVKSKTTGETQVALWDGSNLITKDQQGVPTVLDNKEWFKFMPDKNIRLPTPAGGVTNVGVNEVTGQQTKRPSIGGRGDAIKGTKEEYDAMIKSAAKGQGEAYKVNKDIAELRSIKADPQTLKNPAVFATAYASLMRATVGEKRLTDNEQAIFEGGRYKSLFQLGYNVVDGKFLGNIPDNVIKDFNALLNTTMMKKQADLKAINQTFSNPAQSRTSKGRDTQLRTGGQDPAEVKKKEKSMKADLFAAEKVFAKKFGKGTDNYKRAMELAKSKVGL